MQAPESESGKKTPRFHVPVSLLQEPHRHGAERSCTTLEGASPTSIQKVRVTKGLWIRVSQARVSLSLQCRNLETWVWIGHWSLIGKATARNGRCRDLVLETQDGESGVEAGRASVAALDYPLLCN